MESIICSDRFGKVHKITLYVASSDLASTSLVSESAADIGQIPSLPTNEMGPASEPRLEPLSISIRGVEVSNYIAHL